MLWIHILLWTSTEIKLQTTVYDKFGGPWTRQSHGNKTQQFFDMNNIWSTQCTDIITVCGAYCLYYASNKYLHMVQRKKQTTNLETNS